MSTQTFILCADDYGQNMSVSEGIVALAQAKRINAVSCLVNTPYWHDSAALLSPIQATIYTGLHLNLTFGQALSSLWRQECGDHFNGLGWLIWHSYTRRIKKEWVIAEIRAQLRMFVETLGVLPDFIDGHQHVHQLPVIREALWAVLDTYQPIDFIRSTHHRFCDWFSVKQFPKRQLISLLGGYQLNRELKKRDLAYNTSFSGIYSFAKSKHYERYFQFFLQQICEGGLIMCHPGYLSEDKSDPLYQSRYHEFNYLMSDAFLKNLSDNARSLKQKKPVEYDGIEY